MHKTKSSIKKRFKITGSGHLKMSQAFKQHNLRKRTRSSLRKSKGSVKTFSGDIRRIIRCMPGVRPSTLRLKSNRQLAKELLADMIF